MRQTALLLVCVLGLAFAGCSGPSDSQPSPTDSMTPTTTMDDSNTTFQGVEMPPGTDSQGIVNATSLLQANDAALASTDFRMTENRTTHIRENDTVRVVPVLEGTAVVSSEGVARTQYHNHNFPAGAIQPNETSTGYLDSGTLYRQIVDGDETEYTASEVEASALYGNHVGTLVRQSADEWQPTATTTVDGRDAIVFELEQTDPESALVDNVTGRLVIDSRAVIHEVRYAEETISSDGPAVQEVTRLTLEPKSDLTVEEPPWLDEAKNATG